MSETERISMEQDESRTRRNGPAPGPPAAPAGSRGGSRLGPRVVAGGTASQGRDRGTRAGAGAVADTLRRVTRELKVKSEKHAMGGKATWSLPEATDGASGGKVLTIGGSPSRLDNFRGISNHEGETEGPRD